MATATKTRKANELLTIEDLRKQQAEISKELKGELYWGEDDRLRLQVLPLGIASLDAALGGGLAFDRIAMFVGAYSSGKTLLAMMAMKQAMERGLSVAFVDVERTWVPEWAETLGIKAEDVLVTRPRSGEEAFAQAVAFVKRGVGVVVIDSLGAMRSKVDLDRDPDELMDKSRVGGVSGLITAGVDTLLTENRGSLVILINQLRMKIGGYGNPETFSGGEALRHGTWQIVQVRKGKPIEEGTGETKRRVGQYIKIKLEKNKQSAPFAEAEVPFYYTGEFDEMAGLVDYAIELGVLEAKPPQYWINGERFYGRKKLMDALKERPELFEMVKNAINGVPELEL